jgi:hypothetical protein
MFIFTDPRTIDLDRVSTEDLVEIHYDNHCARAEWEGRDYPANPLEDAVWQQLFDRRRALDRS